MNNNFLSHTRHTHKDNASQLPTEFLMELSDVFNTQYGNKLEQKEVIQVNAEIYQQELVLIVSITQANRLKNFNIYASIDYTKEQTPLNEAIYHLVDSIGFYLYEYFDSNKTILLPTHWQAYEINKRNVYMRYDTSNETLEKISNDILEQHDTK